MNAIEELIDGYHVSVHSILKQNLLPKALEDLDGKIGNIEKALRELIAEKLNSISDTPYKEFVPPIIREAVDNKHAAHKKKYPGLDDDVADIFSKKLKYFTLGETAQIMQKKDCWGQFEEIFVSKSILQNRVNQLTTLRNTLAHNNELNDIMVKDGEAAIIWFDNALGGDKAWLGG